MSLACDNAGALWLGTADAGLYRIYSDSVDLTELRVSMFLEQSVSCPGEADAVISVSVSGGSPPYKYLWERARLKGENNPHSLKAGTYKVTVVDDQGVKASKSLKIADPKTLTNRVVVNNPVTGVTKKNGYAIISPKGGTPPYDVRWENGEKGVEARRLAYGDNALVITDDNGCTTAATVNIKKPKILPDLDIAKIKVGQTVRLNKLYFQADSSTISSDSYDVLEEVYEFMEENKNVFIEIGGHTNDIPPDDYCDKLSTSRAKTVAGFLYSKGILSDRLSFKGYGKRNPVASNESAAGRKRNQRVEIKILRVET